VSGLFVVLSEPDRGRLGCPERLPVDLAETTAREQATLQQAFGYHVPEDLAHAMRAMVDDEQKKLIRDPQVYLALTWLALRQNGHLAARRAEEMAAELDGLDIRLSWTNLDYEADAEGKDDGSTPTGTSTA
jgi:hypothetical protein